MQSVFMNYYSYKVFLMCLKHHLTVTMTSQVILVIIILALSYYTSAENVENKTASKTDDVVESKKVHHMGNVQLSVIRRPSKTPVKYFTKITRPSTLSTTSIRRPVEKVTAKPNKSSELLNYKFQNVHTALGEVKTNKKMKDRPRKHKKHKMNRALMALLLAYKLKFATLIPSIVMGFFLLLGTTALAGFFFALFAAILGLKGQ